MYNLTITSDHDVWEREGYGYTDPAIEAEEERVDTYLDYAHDMLLNPSLMTDDDKSALYNGLYDLQREADRFSHDLRDRLAVTINLAEATL